MCDLTSMNPYIERLCIRKIEDLLVEVDEIDNFTPATPDAALPPIATPAGVAGTFLERAA